MWKRRGVERENHFSKVEEREGGGGRMRWGRERENPPLLKVENSHLRQRHADSAMRTSV